MPQILWAFIIVLNSRKRQVSLQGSERMEIQIQRSGKRKKRNCSCGTVCVQKKGKQKDLVTNVMEKMSRIKHKPERIQMVLGFHITTAFQLQCRIQDVFMSQRQCTVKGCLFRTSTACTSLCVCVRKVSYMSKFVQKIQSHSFQR